LLATLRHLPKPARVDVLVHQQAVRVLRDHPDANRVIGLDRRLLALGPWAPGLRHLRAERYDVVVDCGNWEAPSVTSALVSRSSAGAGIVVGPDVWPLRPLRDVRVARAEGIQSEREQRLHLLSPLSPQQVVPALSFRRRLPSRSPGPSRIVINPGGRLGWRRVPPSAFIAAARAALAAGRAPVVTWGPGEEELAREVADAAPGATVADRTDLDQLADLMNEAGAAICNNTGPMHLAVAAGVPVLAFFFRMDVERWGYPTAPHRMVDLTPFAESEAALCACASAEAASFVRRLDGA
jgi:heptosyltransferase III